MKQLLKGLVPSFIWRKLWLQKILQSHQQTVAHWQPMVDKYLKGEIASYHMEPLHPEKVGKKIIWQYWGQGVGNEQITSMCLPEVVRKCFASVDRYKGDWEVIRLDDSTVANWLSFPDFIHEKLSDPDSGLNRTFYSDLLRVSLLSVYGGAWLDATILMTAPFQKEWLEADLFCFQRDEQEPDKRYWEDSYAYYFGWHPNFKVRFLSSILISSSAHHPLLDTMRDLLLYRWEHENIASEYFFFQILFEMLISGPLKDFAPDVVSDVLPHVVQNKINGGKYKGMRYEDALSRCSLHKMGYFREEALDRFLAFYEEYVDKA